MLNKYFTIYWVNGQRSIIKGNTIEEAFKAVRAGADSVSNVSWYDNGVTETHFWNQKEWVKYEPIRFSSTDAIWKAPFDTIKRTLEEYVKLHHEIIVQFENEDELCLKLTWGDFGTIGPVKYLEVGAAEYCQGTYGGESDDEENQHHFMMAAGQYFSPDNVSAACEALYYRTVGTLFGRKECNIFTTFGKDHARLEDIKASQGYL